MKILASRCVFSDTEIEKIPETIYRILNRKMAKLMVPTPSLKVFGQSIAARFSNFGREKNFLKNSFSVCFFRYRDRFFDQKFQFLTKNEAKNGENEVPLAFK